MSELTFNPMTFPALPAPRRLGSGWWASAVQFFTVAGTTPVATDDRRAPRVYRQRCSYLDTASMGREMYRL